MQEGKAKKLYAAKMERDRQLVTFDELPPDLTSFNGVLVEEADGRVRLVNGALVQFPGEPAPVLVELKGWGEKENRG